MIDVELKDIPLEVWYRVFNDLAGAEQFANGRQILHVVSLKYYYVEEKK
jgi:hypothetical protein